MNEQRGIGLDDPRLVSFRRFGYGRPGPVEHVAFNVEDGIADVFPATAGGTFIKRPNGEIFWVAESFDDVLGQFNRYTARRFREKAVQRVKTLCQQMGIELAEGEAPPVLPGRAVNDRGDATTPGR